MQTKMKMISFEKGGSSHVCNISILSTMGVNREVLPSFIVSVIRSANLYADGSV